MIGKVLSVGSAMLRITVAALLLTLCSSYWPSTAALDAFDALPEVDWLAAAEAERAAGRTSDALLLLDAGLESADSPTAAQDRQALERARAVIIAERDGLRRRLTDAGKGALTGEGTSAEALGGAIVADLFVFGDVRDLVVQGAKALRGDETDEVLVLLSVVGLATTVAPGADASLALLKFARRVGAVGEPLARRLLRLLRRAVETRQSDEVVAVANDFSRLSERAQPAVALRILGQVDDPQTLRRVADFAERPSGALALSLGGARSIDWLKAHGRGGEQLLLVAGRKGGVGIDFLTRRGKLLLRPHPLLGLVKSIYQGRWTTLLQQLLATHAKVIAGFVAGWLLYELLWLKVVLNRFYRGGFHAKPQT